MAKAISDRVAKPTMLPISCANTAWYLKAPTAEPRIMKKYTTTTNWKKNSGVTSIRLWQRIREKLPDDWMKGYEKILNREMGKVPNNFEFEGKKYTPQSYLKDYLKINPDDYVEFTSFTHHPYYSKFFLEIPDNWSFDLYNNIKMDELFELIDSSIAQGYTVGWGGDVSEHEFNSRKGIAIVPENDWEHKSDEERKRTCEIHENEMKITPEIRQKEFDNWHNHRRPFYGNNGHCQGPVR